MKMTLPSHNAETLTDTTDSDAAAKAKRRAGLIVASEAEVELYCYEPNGARRNDNPGIPCDDYSD